MFTHFQCFLFDFQDFAQDAMSEITGSLDLELEKYADMLIDGVNNFNVSTPLGIFTFCELQCFH